MKLQIWYFVIFVHDPYSVISTILCKTLLTKERKEKERRDTRFELKTEASAFRLLFTRAKENDTKTCMEKRRAGKGEGRRRRKGIKKGGEGKFSSLVSRRVARLLPLLCIGMYLIVVWFTQCRILLTGAIKSPGEVMSKQEFAGNNKILYRHECLQRIASRPPFFYWNCPPPIYSPVTSRIPFHSYRETMRSNADLSYTIANTIYCSCIFEWKIPIRYFYHSCEY